MTGISGAFGPRLGDEPGLAARMTSTLRRSPDTSYDHWFGDCGFLCQVSHHQDGIAVSPDGTKRIAIWGEPRLACVEPPGGRCEPLVDPARLLSSYEEKGAAFLRELDG